MKPLGTNNLGFFGFIGYLILFNIPYIGKPANVIVAIFSKDRGTKVFSWVYLVISLLFSLGSIIYTLLGFGALGFFGLEEFFPVSEGVLAYLPTLIG